VISAAPGRSAAAAAAVVDVAVVDVADVVDVVNVVAVGWVNEMEPDCGSWREVGDTWVMP